MDGILIYLLVKAAGSVLCVNVSSVAWSLEVQGKGVASLVL